MKKAIAFLTVIVISFTFINLKANAAKVEEEIYFFDFEDSDELPSEFEWNNVGNAKIIEVDGSKVLELSGGGYNFIFIGDSIDGDIAIDLKLKVTKHIAKGGAQFTFREDKSKGNARYGYHVCFGDMTVTDEYGLELRKRTMNDFTEKVRNPLDYDDEWHDFRVEVVGHHVKLFMDGELMAEQTMSGYDAGHVTISSYLDTALFDDIKISKLVDAPETEPESTNPETSDPSILFGLVLFTVLASSIIIKKRVFV